MNRGAQERLVFKVIQTTDNATTATKQQPPKRARSAQPTPSTSFPYPEEASPLCILPDALGSGAGLPGFEPRTCFILAV